MDLNNKVALVTGGASGLGQATVEAYVAKGAKAVILDINEDKALEIINNLGEDKVMFISTDIMKEDPVVEAINKIKDNFGGLHIAVNCAGTGYPGRILGKEAPHPLDAFQFIVNLNLVGTFNVMRIAAELMDKNEPDEKGEKGVIINTASIAGIEGQIGQSAYSASKGGISAFSKTLAVEYGVQGVNVNCVCPASIETNMSTQTPLPSNIDKRLLKKIMPVDGVNRTPEDIASAIVFLASEDAVHINGIDLRVDGGLLT